MKLQFESNLDYQLAGIESVCDLFRGQEICTTEFTVTREFGRGQAALAGLEIEEHELELPDLLADLQDKTQLTRRSLVRILTESERLGDFKRNPQEFIDIAAESINRVKRLAIVDGIKYQRIGDETYWAQELFEVYFVVETKSSLLNLTTTCATVRGPRFNAARSTSRRWLWERTRRVLSRLPVSMTS